MKTLLVPQQGETVPIAVDIFQGLWQAITGERLAVAYEGEDPGGDLIVFGGDADNRFTHEQIMAHVIPSLDLPTGGEAYRMLSVTTAEGRTFLFLAGARPRALLYAIYHFFELRGGCHYFFDGDVIPHRKDLDLAGLDVLEMPRFQYRGLRYFAHRSLHRFQAEQWNLEDWKREIDWILKKRLNLFMLRIGMDDIFQKAFPDIVPYPEDGPHRLPEFARSHSDRTHFWSLQERGRLRKALLDYAFDRDLMHPEDMGTMTHWYAATPTEYIDAVNPPVLAPKASWTHKTLDVWDIRRQDCLDAYWKLTQTHIKAYGRPEIFHTIGLAERMMAEDTEANLNWKIYAYNRVIGKLRQQYPDAPLLIASWDFYNGHWTYDEMHRLKACFDPQRTLILDYTSDTNDEQHNFINWDIYRTFPWIFGIFQAFESGNDLRGNYEVIKRRLALASADPYCKGMIIWPENAHSDVLMYEFFAANAWRPDCMDIETFIPRFCQARYPEDDATMTRLWLAFLPVIKAGFWNHNQQYYGETFAHIYDTGTWCYSGAVPPPAEKLLPMLMATVERLRSCIAPACTAMKALTDIPLDKPMVFRDCIDLARTTAARLFQFLYDRIYVDYLTKQSGFEPRLELLKKLLKVLTRILDASPQFSLNDSLDDLRASASVNPSFEATLKANAETNYNRTFVSELCHACYQEECDIFAEEIMTGKRHQERYDQVRNRFHQTPLEALRIDHDEARAHLQEAFAELALLAEEVRRWS